MGRKWVGLLVVIAMSMPIHRNMAEAAVITWRIGGTYDGNTGFQSIDTAGILVEAVTVGGSSSLLVDPAGLNITFVPKDILDQASFSSGNPSTADTGWNSVIDVADWNFTNLVIDDFASGLTVGQEYQIQLFASDARPAFSSRTQFFTDGQGNQSPTIMQGNFTSIIGTFTADATTQALGLEASSNFPILNAYVLRVMATPEPGSLGLLIGAGWMMWGMRRRVL